MKVNSEEDIVDDVAVLEVPIKANRIGSKELGFNIVKRIVDIIGAIVGIICLIPLTIGIAIANIFVGDKGPIFYTQQRIGKNGKLFKLYKYRSMVVGADEILKDYLAENENARKEYKINKKLRDDPRITKVGKFIRKSSLDEFPQFINVLKGDMSLVGPRPYLPRERDDIGSYYSYIIKDKPGITGLWQVSGRSDVSFERRLALDLEYHDSKCLKLYFKILWKTVLNVIGKNGAI